MSCKRQKSKIYDIFHVNLNHKIISIFDRGINKKKQ